MIAARWATLLLAAVLAPLACGAAAPATPRSETMVIVTAAVALLAPLFWPGRAATSSGTVVRLLLWSIAAVVAAASAVVLLRFGRAGSAAAELIAPCALLFVLLLLAHAIVAALEPPLVRRGLDAAGARELAGRSVALALALLGSLPLWLGPAAEALTAGQPGSIDAAVAISPLVHLAVAAGNDLLHNAWVYRHSNLAPQPVNFPEPAQLAWGYGAAAVLLAAAALRSGLPRAARAQ